MWSPDGYTYNEFSVFGLKVSLNLQNSLRKCNPEIEKEGALYTVLCILDPDLDALSPDSVPLDQEGTALFNGSVIECFGRETPYAFARTGRTIVLVLRTEGPASAEEEGPFMQDIVAFANHFHFSIEDNIGYPVSISIGPAFDRFEDCDQVACEALTQADFVRFAELPTAVVTPEYCANVKDILEKRNPGYQISNYERPIISAVLNDNLAHAERIVNDLLTAHLIDPLYVFPSVRSNMFNIMRMCQSMCCLEPRAFADETPRLPLLQKEMGICPTAGAMRALIHEYFELLDSYSRQNREAEARTERMNKILKYISKNVSNPLLGAPMVCDEFNMSTTYFSRIFKEDLGVNFSVYLQTLRITKAKKLLLETDMNLNAVAQEVGYISSQNLLRLFKRYEGMSPSSYRQMAGGKYVPDEEE